MAQTQRYSRPPLTEALLDIQVTLPPDFAVASLLKCYEFVEGDYPAKQPLRRAFGTIELGEQVAATAEAHDVGYRFVSADKLQLFQARRDGFTHNRLAPYLGWEPFAAEARRLWDVYREVAKPVAIRRVAVRYINRLDLPGGHVNLKDFLRTSPEVSPDLTQDMAAFFMQVTLPIPELKALVNLTQTGAEPVKPDSVSVIFDLDLYRTVDAPTDEDELWKLFGEFREKKDEVFEACITNATREIIR